MRFIAMFGSQKVFDAACQLFLTGSQLVFILVVPYYVQILLLSPAVIQS